MVIIAADLVNKGKINVTEREDGTVLGEVKPNIDV